MKMKECKLTTDDLIVEYMAYKIQNGYEPQYFVSEFMDFLRFFKNHMNITENEDDKVENGYPLMLNFFKRKKNDWFQKPHMDVLYNSKEKDFLIKANYLFSAYDLSVINTHHMEKDQVKKIRTLIEEFLKNMPKRNLDIKNYNAQDLLMGKQVSVTLIAHIWESFISDLVKKGKWPTQCTDIFKYLLDFDLAPLIELPSIKQDIIKLYQILPIRIANLYQELEGNVKIESQGNLLAQANYNLLIKGFEDIIGIAFGNKKKTLNIDLTKHTFTEIHEREGTYFWDDDPDIVRNTTKIGNEQAKQLVLRLENIKNS
mgnify:FL=1